MHPPDKAGDCSAGEDDARSPTKMRSVARYVGMNPDIRSLVAVILELAESGKWARGLQLGRSEQRRHVYHASGSTGRRSRSAALADSSEDEEDGCLIFNHLDVRTDIVSCRTSTRIEAGPFVSSHSHSLTTHHHACMRAIGLTALSDLAPASHVVLI